MYIFSLLSILQRYTSQPKATHNPRVIFRTAGRDKICGAKYRQDPLYLKTRSLPVINYYRCIRPPAESGRFCIYLCIHCDARIMAQPPVIHQLLLQKTSQYILFIAEVFSLSNIHGKFCIIPQIGKKTGLIIPKGIKTCHRYPIPI